MNPLILTVTGPSGSGKTVLSHELRERGFEPLISTTTRAPRQGEKNGVDYYFVTHEEFDEMGRKNGLIESVEYDGNKYGISSAEAERAFGKGKPAVLVAEPHGVSQIHAYCTQRQWNVMRIFVSNPLETLVLRLLERFQQDTAKLSSENPKELHALLQKLNVYTARILKVTGFEQENWVKPALNGTRPYELIIESFDASNKKDVVEKVIQTVDENYGPVSVKTRPRP